MKLLFSVAATAALFFLSSCGGDDDNNTPPSVENTSALCQDGIDNDGDGMIDCADGDCADFAFCEETETLGGSIGTRTLTNDKIYIIDRFAYVDDGDVLTINPGTILKANDGDGADASAFIVARGGKIIANGSPENPIIFTSVRDGISLGETESTLDPTQSENQGLWGGLIILGKAPVSVKPSNAADGIGREGFVEGVPSTFEFSKYGGNEDNDDSGELSYVSIRYTGTTLATNEEIQGLTLGGVGSETDISNIEIYSSDDDGIECFGGSVSVTNLLIAYQADDAIDIDMSYSGTIDNALVLLYNGATGNDGMEIDGPEATGVNDTGFFTIQNTTIYQKGAANIARCKSNAQGTIKNFVAKDFNGQTFLLDGAKDITIMDSEFNEAQATAITETDVDSFTNTNNMFSVTSFTKGANETVFDWTFSKSQGLF